MTSFGTLAPLWPLGTEPKAWTKGGSFGAHRDDEPDDRDHQGIDLGAPYGTPVFAVDDGVIAAKDGWSGSETAALFVDHEGDGAASLVPYTAVYGGIKPGSHPPVGTKVRTGDQIAVVGRYPGGSTMLHWEAWIYGQRPPRPRWSDKAPKPAGLYDPADYLIRAMQNWTPAPPASGGAVLLAIAGIAVVAGVALIAPKLRRRRR